MQEKSAGPGWPEIVVGLVTFAVLLVPFGLLFGLLPPERVVLQGVVGSTAGGFLGIGAFAAACALRIRALRPFGFRPAAPRWLVMAFGLAFVAYGLNLVIQFTWLAWFGRDDPQGILHAAARDGVRSFSAMLLGGALLTPFGEEILFRGVVANALNRYGAWAGVGLSAIIFGLAHGTSVILPVAIMFGVIAGMLFRASGSIWPSVVLHSAYNAINSFASFFGFAPMH